MVEISKFYDVDIYTIAGQYVGRVADVVLNIKYGTISKLIVRASVPEKRSTGFMDILTGGFKLNTEEEGIPNYQEGLVEVSYDKVKAIGDIMLVDPQGLFRKRQEPPQVSDIDVNPQASQNPQDAQIPSQTKPEEPIVENSTSASMINDIPQPTQNPEIRKVE